MRRIQDFKDNIPQGLHRDLRLGIRIVLSNRWLCFPLCLDFAILIICSLLSIWIRVLMSKSRTRIIHIDLAAIQIAIMLLLIILFGSRPLFYQYRLIIQCCSLLLSVLIKFDVVLHDLISVPLHHPTLTGIFRALPSLAMCIVHHASKHLCTDHFVLGLPNSWNRLHAITNEALFDQHYWGPSRQVFLTSLVSVYLREFYCIFEGKRGV